MPEPPSLTVKHRSRAVSVLLLAVLVVSLTGAGCSSCLVEGTMIDTPEGPRPIETLRVNDAVWTRSASGALEVGHVVSTSRHVASRHLFFRLADGNGLRVTAIHPIASESGWRQAGELAEGNALRTLVGWVRIASVTEVRSPAAVYDLTVSPQENFFASGVLVHNKSVVPPPKRSDMADVWVGSDITTFYRIELRPDGTGRCSMSCVVSEPLVFDVRRWQLLNYDIEIELHRVGGPGGQPVIMKGHTSGGTIDLESHCHRPVQLWRERDAAATWDRLKGALDQDKR